MVGTVSLSTLSFGISSEPACCRAAALARLVAAPHSLAPATAGGWREASVFSLPLAIYPVALGLVGCVLAKLPHGHLDLDQFHYAKEFVLTTTALVASLAAAVGVRRLRPGRTDLLLLAFLGWAVVTGFGAVNSWWAVRGLGTMVAGVALFWVARRHAREGFRRQVLSVVAAATVLAALTSLLEAWGVLPRLSLEGRAPGGVMGHRNMMAHLLLLGSPALVLHALGARTRPHRIAVHLAMAATAAVLLLSRTRAAWLALGVVLAATVAGALMARQSVRGALPSRRAARLGAAAVAGALAAWLLPNRLTWNSPSPYAESLRTIVDYRSGTGRGRLLQYANNMRIVRDHPVGGVGAGNWPVAYLAYAPPDDPTKQMGSWLLPGQRLHNGDWIGYATELGVPGALFLLLAGASLLGGCLRVIRRSANAERVLRAIALGATLLGLGVLGLFDSPLHTAASGFLLFTTAGALAPPERRGPALVLTYRGQAAFVMLVLLALLLGAFQSSRQLAAAALYRSATPASLSSAIRIHPGDYRAHMLMVYYWSEAGRCDLAASWFERARPLFPSARTPQWLRRGCPTQAPGSS